MLDSIRVCAFVGPSGTGKSHRAQMVAKENDCECIIDDAILIRDNKILAGTSAKKAGTKLESVKKALFSTEGQVEEIRKALEENKPKSVLVLGTSDEMVQKIVANIGLNEISKTIYIQEVSTPEEMEAAKNIRMKEGKHVIPVPTFEIKKDFSGYLLDPLQIFKWKGKGTTPYMTEKSIIRPTYSYLGNYKISDNVIKDIIEYATREFEGIYKIQKIKIDTYPEGLVISMDLTLEYGFDFVDILTKLKTRIKKDIDRLTAMNIVDIKLTAKNIHINN